MFYLDDSSGVALMSLAAAAIHEAGHVITSILLGGRVEALTLSVVGAELKLSYFKGLSYGRENIVLLSGAATNLLLGAIAFSFGAYQMAGVTVCLGAFNLLPVIPLDGGRILFNLLSEHFSLVWAEKITTIVSGIFAGIFAGIGAIWLTQLANILPLMLSLWLLAGILRKNSNFF